MAINTSDRKKPEVKAPPKVRKPGRPWAIPAELEPATTELYRRGYGYRAIARIFCEEFGVSVNFSTVKRVLKRVGVLDKAGDL